MSSLLLWLQPHIERLWYHTPRNHRYLRFFSFLSHAYCHLAAMRKRHLLARQVKQDIPVVVVGNISIGGTGKTPLIIYLVHLLQQQGYRPGVVSRGYGGKSIHQQPQQVTAMSDPAEVGDEPVLIAQRAQVIVVVHAERNQAIRTLRECYPACDVILSDDGLQHYQMGRAVEIAVIDGERRFGNQYCFPVGPLREPLARLEQCDLVVVNGKSGDWYTMNMQPNALYRLDNAQRAIILQQMNNQPVHMVTGIGNPERFFNTLRQLGMRGDQHTFPDHHLFQEQDLQFDDDLPVIITEKDAVKCRQFKNQNVWCLSVDAVLSSTFDSKFLRCLKEFQK